MTEPRAKKTKTNATSQYKGVTKWVVIEGALYRTVCCLGTARQESSRRIYGTQRLFEEGRKDEGANEASKYI